MPDLITERDLFLPSLYLMNMNGGVIEMKDLREKLRLIMRPTGEDLAILSGRNDDKFSQKVRNLNLKRGFHLYAISPERGFFEMTQLGKDYLKENQDTLQCLFTNDFSYQDITDVLKIVETNKDKKKIQIFDENTIIQEGNKKVIETSIYERSSILRNYAIHFFTKDDRISCNCCAFNFGDFYGEETAKGFIEIHHTKPIFKYEDEDIENTLKNAVKNLTPLCANCHRMIHRNPKKQLEIEFLIEKIKANGIFNRI